MWLFSHWTHPRRSLLSQKRFSGKWKTKESLGKAVSCFLAPLQSSRVGTQGPRIPGDGMERVSVPHFQATRRCQVHCIFMPSPGAVWERGPYSPLSLRDLTQLTALRSIEQCSAVMMQEEARAVSCPAGPAVLSGDWRGDGSTKDLELTPHS